MDEFLLLYNTYRDEKAKFFEKIDKIGETLLEEVNRLNVTTADNRSRVIRREIVSAICKFYDLNYDIRILDEDLKKQMSVLLEDTQPETGEPLLNFNWNNPFLTPPESEITVTQPQPEYVHDLVPPLEEKKQIDLESSPTFVTALTSPTSAAKAMKIHKKHPIYQIDEEILEIGDECHFCYIKDSSEFYIRKNTNSFQQFEEAFIREIYNESFSVMKNYGSKAAAEACVGNFCYAFITEKWYRVEILDWNSRDDNVSLFLIDYGRNDCIHYRYLRIMNESVTKFPKFAIKCHLAKEKTWSSSIVEKLSGIDVTISYVNKECDSYAVDFVLEEPGQLLDESGVVGVCPFTNENGLCFKGPKCELNHVRRSLDDIVYIRAFTELLIPPVGTEIIILPTGFKSASNFYAQIISERKESSVYNDNFQNLVDSLKSKEAAESFEVFKYFPRSGEVLLALHCGEWFRGICRSFGSSEDSFQIFLVDYGIVIYKNLSELRQIKKDFLHVPFQAVECVLYNCNQTANSDITKACDFFFNVMYFKIFSAEIISKNDRFVIKILGTDFDTALNKFGFAEDCVLQSRLTAIRSEFVEIFITSLVDFDVCSFYAHILTNRTKSKYFNDEFQDFLSEMSSIDIERQFVMYEETPKNGEFVLVKYFLNWYRAKCLGKSAREANSVDLFFLDFGDKRTMNINKIRRMPKEFLRVPFQAVHCTLSNCIQTSGICEKEIKQFFADFMNLKVFNAFIVDTSGPLTLQIRNQKLELKHQIDFANVISSRGFGTIVNHQDIWDSK